MLSVLPAEGRGGLVDPLVARGGIARADRNGRAHVLELKVIGFRAVLDYTGQEPLPATAHLHCRHLPRAKDASGAARNLVYTP